MNSFSKKITIYQGVLLLSFFFFLTGCNHHHSKIPVKIYYFNFSGYNRTNELATIHKNLLDEFSKYDYCITPDQRLIYIPRDTAITPALLDKLHPALHRVDIYDSTKDYKTGATRVDVELIANEPGGVIKTHYIWYKKMENGKWKLTYDFGVMTLHTISSDGYEKWKHFLGTEFARETYR